MNNLVLSISYLEFTNKITSLINELLYSPNDGYMFLNSKDAVVGIDILLKKFNYEAQKIEKEYNFSDSNDFVKQKKNELLQIAKEHYEKEIINWADDVFDELADNILFKLANDKINAQMYYLNLCDAIEWLAKIKNFNKEEKNSILQNYKIKFEKALKTNISNFIPKKNPAKSDTDEFIRLWKLVLLDKDEFLEQNFDDLTLKLTNDDITFFNSIKNKIQNSIQNQIIDEIYLINSAIENCKLKKNVEIYDFIKMIQTDFNLFFEQNKKINEEDKIKLTKRRMALFLDKNKESKEYFKKLITSLNE